MLDEFAAQFSAIPETGAWCYGTGMPSVMLSTVSYPIEIVQHPSRLVMLAELEMQVRRVYLDGRAHPDDFLPQGVGHSVGTWDGNTLVIDTALLSDWQVRPWPRSPVRRKGFGVANGSCRPRGGKPGGRERDVRRCGQCTGGGSVPATDQWAT